MRKICYFFSCICFLLILCGCREPNLSNYHYVGEKWTEIVDDTIYTIDYYKEEDDWAYLTITRDTELLIDGEVIDKIYMKAGGLYTIDKVLADNTKPESSFYFLVFPMQYYVIGHDNVANISLHAKDEFHGYVKISIESSKIEPQDLFSMVLY